MDRCGLVIEDVERCHIFTGHTNFNSFANETMKRRQEAILNKDKVRDLFNKISLNSSYGYNIVNQADYSKVKIVNKHKCSLAHLTPTFRSATTLGEDLCLVESVANSFECKTGVQVGIATLDIAKFLYLNFIYNFMSKC
jgi:hypothetical protein